MAGIARELERQIRIMLRPLAARIANSITRGVVKLVDDSGGTQRVQGLGNLAEVIEGTGGAEHLQPYGFFSVPLPGADAVFIFPNGDRSHPIAIVVADRRYKPTNGQGGEVGLRTDEGDEIRLGRSHVMTFTTSGTIKLGSSGAAGDVVVQAALDDLVAALTSAIAANPGPIAAALAAFKTALQALNAGAGWKARTSKTKAE